jgi:hypothetical protein
VALPIVVVGLLIIGLVWRARTTRKLTIEESVDRYRRTLSAVHDAAARSVDPRDESEGPSLLGPARADPARSVPPRFAPPQPGPSHRITVGSRRSLLVAAMAAATIVAMAVVIAAGHGKGGAHKTAGATTTRPHTTSPSTTTTRPAPTTTAPLLVANVGSKTDFTVSKVSYTLVVQTTNGACWVDVRSPTGTALFSGTLSVGASQSVTAGAMTVRLGNPAAATLSIDGTPVPIDLTAGSPLTLHFQGRTA